MLCWIIVLQVFLSCENGTIILPKKEDSPKVEIKNIDIIFTLSITDTTQKDQKRISELVDRISKSLQREPDAKKSGFKNQRMIIDTLLRIDPTNASALYLNAQIFSNLKSYDSALAVLNKAVKHHPNFVKFRVFRGALHDLTGDGISAANDYKSALAITANQVDSLENGKEKKLFLLGTMSTLKVLLNQNKEEVLSDFDMETNNKGYNLTTKQRVRGTIARFEKSAFLASYERGQL